MSPEQEAEFKARFDAENRQADPEFAARLAAEDAAAREKMINPVGAALVGSVGALGAGRFVNLYGKGTEATLEGLIKRYNIPQEVVSKGSNAVINYIRSQHIGDIGYVGGEDYKRAHALTERAKELSEKAPLGYKYDFEAGQYIPEDEFNKRQAVRDAAEKARVAAERKNLPNVVKIAEKHPGTARAILGAENILRGGVPAFAGRTLAGGFGGYSAAEAYNRGVQGDVPGAIISGAGAAGSALSLAPDPKKRAIGIGLMGLSALGDRLYTSPTIESPGALDTVRGVSDVLFGTPPAGRAEGGLAHMAKGKSVSDAIKKFAFPAAEKAGETQIPGTIPTYRKADEILNRLGAQGLGLDYGAGLGKGVKEMSGEFQTFEPFHRNKWTPDFTKAEDIPSDAYGRLVNLNVLNVLNPEARAEAVKNIGRVMEPGGTGIVTTRGMDVLKATGPRGPEPSSIITSKGTYQKGFTPAELEEYLRYMLGEGYDISKLGLGPAGATIRKKAEGGLAHMAGGGEVAKQTLKALDQLYKKTLAGNKVGSLTVGQEIPNTASISASGISSTLPEVRVVPMSSFEVTAPHDLFYAKNDIDRVRNLAEQIKQSGRIDPLIVGVDEKGNYIIEGAHRLGALHLLGQKEFPALMAIEEGVLNAVKKAKGGSTTPAWQRKEGQNPEGGLNAKGRASYHAETGGTLKRPQPEGGARKKSFCARMTGMKKKLTSSKTANDPDSRINKSLRAWNC